MFDTIYNLISGNNVVCNVMVTKQTCRLFHQVKDKWRHLVIHSLDTCPSQYSELDSLLYVLLCYAFAIHWQVMSHDLPHYHLVADTSKSCDMTCYTTIWWQMLASQILGNETNDFIVYA